MTSTDLATDAGSVGRWPPRGCARSLERSSGRGPAGASSRPPEGPVRHGAIGHALDADPSAYGLRVRTAISAEAALT